MGDDWKQPGGRPLWTYLHFKKNGIIACGAQSRLFFCSTFSLAKLKVKGSQDISIKTFRERPTTFWTGRQLIPYWDRRPHSLPHWGATELKLVETQSKPWTGFKHSQGTYKKTKNCSNLHSHIFRYRKMSWLLPTTTRQVLTFVRYQCIKCLIVNGCWKREF